MITICLTYFKSLTLANLDAALHSVRQQDLSQVREIIVFDNDTADDSNDILDVIDSMGFPVPIRLVTVKHGDSTRTHSWSSNAAVREAATPWVLFTRADYLLDFKLVAKFATRVLEYKGMEWNGFVTGNGCHLADTIETCERTKWRMIGPYVFNGATFDYTLIDAGVWMAQKAAFERIGGLDESLTAWGHAQTDFQHRLHSSGVEFIRIPETLFWHPFHGGERDIDVAHEQLREKGADLKKMWARYEGVSPY